MKKRITYSTKKQLEGVRWTSRVIDFGVSLTINIAFNELYTAHMMLRERKDLYRQKIKKQANDTIRLVDAKKAQILNLMANRKFFDTYIEKVVDISEKDISVFRESIRKTIEQANGKNAELISYIETARSLTNAAVAQFEEVMKTSRELYGSFEWKQPFYNFKWEQTFCEFNCSDILKSWDALCKMIYDSNSDIDLNTKETNKLFDDICEKFADGFYVKECLQEAHEECPDFITNDIVVKE